MFRGILRLTEALMGIWNPPPDILNAKTPGFGIKPRAAIENAEATPSMQSSSVRSDATSLRDRRRVSGVFTELPRKRNHDAHERSADQDRDKASGLPKHQQGTDQDDEGRHVKAPAPSVW